MLCFRSCLSQKSLTLIAYVTYIICSAIIWPTLRTLLGEVDLNEVPESHVVLNLSSSIVRMSYLHLPKLPCRSANDEVDDVNMPYSRIIIMVKSTLMAFDRRQAIRQTWGRVAAGLNVPVVFILGSASQRANNDDQKRIFVEASKFGDLLQADFPDNYRNLSRKSLAMLLWETIACPTVYYFFHTDDDCIVFVDNLLRYVRMRFPSGKHAGILHGSCWVPGSPVIRNQSMKNYIKHEYYPRPTYPSYCSGTGFLISRDVPEKLLSAIWTPEILDQFGNLDDVLYTGILAERAKIKPVHGRKMLFFNTTKSKFVIKPCEQQIISTHDYKPVSLFLSQWQLFSQNMKACRRL